MLAHSVPSLLTASPVTGPRCACRQSGRQSARQGEKKKGETRRGDGAAACPPPTTHHHHTTAHIHPIPPCSAWQTPRPAIQQTPHSCVPATATAPDPTLSPPPWPAHLVVLGKLNPLRLLLPELDVPVRRGGHKEVGRLRHRNLRHCTPEQRNRRPNLRHRQANVQDAAWWRSSAAWLRTRLAAAAAAGGGRQE